MEISSGEVRWIGYSSKECMERNLFTILKVFTARSILINSLKLIIRADTGAYPLCWGESGENTFQQPF